MRHLYFIPPIVLSALLIVGCSSSESPSRTEQRYSPPMASVAMNSTGLSGFMDEAVEKPNAGQVSETVPEAIPEKAARKIIYNTSISLNVESFDGVAAKVTEMTETCSGFVAGASLSGTTGNQRSGSWTIRIPIDQYRAFLDSVGSLGEFVSRNEQTREVTTEFYDIEARVRNKQTEEKRLISILEERPGKLDEILNIEKEISRVRGEIEQLQGRLRVLQDLTAFSTVTLQISEVQNYVPQETPTFSTLIDRKWQSILNDLASAGQAIVLTMIGVGPWLFILLLPAVPVYFVVRRAMKPQTSQMAT